MRVLVIEDNEKMASVLSRGLEQEGFAVDVCHTGYDGIEKAMVGQYAAIVLDVMLPDHNGIAACRDLRRLEVDTPILLLTALSETKDKVDGLNAGADDYLAKPFEFEYGVDHGPDCDSACSRWSASGSSCCASTAQRTAYM